MLSHQPVRPGVVGDRLTFAFPDTTVRVEKQLTVLISEVKVPLYVNSH
jgi:hypothetical protein